MFFNISMGNLAKDQGKTLLSEMHLKIRSVANADCQMFWRTIFFRVVNWMLLLSQICQPKYLSSLLRRKETLHTFINYVSNVHIIKMIISFWSE